MRKLFLCAVMSGLAGSAFAAEAIDHDWRGTWAFEPAWCANADRIGSATPAPIATTETEVLGYENSCRIVESSSMPDLRAVQLELLCEAEGTQSEDSRLLMMSGPDEMWMWNGAGEPLRFERCPGSEQ